MSDAATEKPSLEFAIPPERFPLSIQAIAPTGEVVFSKTIQSPRPGSKDTIHLPKIGGRRVTVRITFADGESAVFHDVFVA